MTSKLEKTISATEQLKELLDGVITERRTIARLLSTTSRKNRNEMLSAHREVKKREYELGDSLAALELSTSLASGNKKKIEAATKRFKRFKSRLNHEDWLLWTRSIWKFKDMESQARTGLHPAQFSSKVPERLIRMFSFVDDTVLDPFLGSGTTCVEAIRFGRKSVGIDINPDFLQLARSRVHQVADDLMAKDVQPSECSIYLDDARYMKSIPTNSIQLIVTHPPYWNCLTISTLPDDLSNCDNDSYPEFLVEMEKVIRQCYRVLQSDRVCALMIGDITRKVGGITRHFPLHADILKMSEEIGFHVWDIYIVETKMRDSGGMPMMGSYPYPHKIFAQFAHNYIVVLRKPAST